MKKFLQKLFRYMTADNNDIPYTDESEIVDFVYNKFNEYTENPPYELVQNVIDSYNERNEQISYEDAKKQVPYNYIKKHIAKEVNQKFKVKQNESYSFLKWLSE